jgi:hypothetical protein
VKLSFYGVDILDSETAVVTVSEVEQQQQQVAQQQQQLPDYRNQEEVLKYIRDGEGMKKPGNQVRYVVIEKTTTIVNDCTCFLPLQV